MLGSVSRANPNAAASSLGLYPLPEPVRDLAHALLGEHLESVDPVVVAEREFACDPAVGHLYRPQVVEIPVDHAGGSDLESSQIPAAAA